MVTSYIPKFIVNLCHMQAHVNSFPDIDVPTSVSFIVKDVVPYRLIFSRD